MRLGRENLKRNLRAIRVLVRPKVDFSKLDSEISCEITNDIFARKISEIVALPENYVFMEIGSSTGAGSTESFVSAIASKKSREKCLLICFEVSRGRQSRFLQRYSSSEFVKSFLMSSVSLTDYPSYYQLVKFYFCEKHMLKDHGLLSFLSWMRAEKHYILNNVSVPFSSGIVFALKEFGINYPDVVLIDGSEFTGRAELELVWGARYIFLDDVLNFKNKENYKILKSSSNYDLVFEELTLRNGFALFKKSKD